MDPAPLQLKHMIGAQPADVVRHVTRGRPDLIKLGELAHDGFGFGRLGVGDVDGKLPGGVDLVQLVGQHGRGEVAGQAGELTLAVAEGRLDDEHGHIHGVDAGPEGGVALGITAENPPWRLRAGGAAQGVTDGGHGVLSRQDFNDAITRFQYVTCGQWLKGDQRRRRRRQSGEIRPDDVVEDVLAQGGNGLGQGMHAQGPPSAGRSSGVHHQGQAGDVVQVRVRQEHVLNAHHFLEREVAHARARVDQRVLIEQERGGAAVAGDGA